MAVIKAVELVRKIRDKHYEETKGLSVEEQIKFIRKKSGDLQKRFKRSRRSSADNRAQTAKV